MSKEKTVEELEIPPEVLAKVEESVTRKLMAKFKSFEDKLVSSDKLGPKPPRVFTKHIERLENLKIKTKKLPTSMKVRLSGLSTAGSVRFSKRHGLNRVYIASTNTTFSVTDKNDMCFFIIKATKNPGTYEIVEPKGLLG